MKSRLSALALSLALVAGCTTPPPPPPSGPERLSQQVARNTLERAQKSFDEGDYAATISTLRGGASLFDAAEPVTRTSAMKLEAFSYCVLNQLPECRAQFRKLLDTYPSFNLDVAERTHPVWGPAFETAKRMKR
ncbi:MAG: hypothetical protein EOP81_11105 [Variovorax sp.]|nr:MAG: hypothetical protein EOP81_11105 [Variovorax sp.]